MSEPEPIKRPIILSTEEARTKEILLLQPTYLLDEKNFNKLIKGTTGFKDWAQKVLFMSIGWAFKLTSALIVFLVAYHTAKTNEKVELKIEMWEVVSVILALIVCLILYVIGRFVRNEKDKLIESIKNHFESHN